MDKLINTIIKLVDNFIIIISNIIKRIKLLLLKWYKNIQFLTNKQNTIKAMYEPLLEKNITENTLLSKKLKKIKNDNNELLMQIKKLEKENLTIKLSSETLQQLIARRSL